MILSILKLLVVLPLDLSMISPLKKPIRLRLTTAKRPARGGLRGDDHALTSIWPATQVQLDSAGHHDYGLWTVASFVHSKFDRLSTIDKKTTSEPLWILTQLPWPSLPIRKSERLEVGDGSSS